ncbi:DUF881 domain-containing protein [Actinomycetes bacterium KLBMP 9797]
MSDKPRAFTPDFLTELFRNPLEPGYAEAAARRRARGADAAPPGTAIRLISALTVVAVGFLLVIAYRQTVADEPSRSQARAGLIGQIERRQAETDQSERDAERLRSEVARLREQALGGSEAERLRELETVTGTSRVRGDGVVVRLDDAPSAVDAVTGADGKKDLGRVLDRDLQDLANALWSVGAEAIAINDQRLTATSTIRAAGAAILVDFRPVTRPYEIRAIGPDDMDKKLRDSPTGRLFRALVDDEGMSFDVRDAEDLTLPAAAEPDLRYAKPPPSSSPSPSSSGGGK